MAGYQQSILKPGDPTGDRYPSAAPDHEHQWHDLVRVFLDGARAASALGQTPERLALEVEGRDIGRRVELCGGGP